METKIPQVGSKIDIQSYKHDGSLHRTWKDSYVIEANKDMIVCVTDKTQVVEADGRRWVTREPAIYFLYTKKWYNIIAMMRKTGVFYYCNIATPCVMDEEALKNIDYDLDVKVLPNNTYQILDENEYKYHAEQMNYPEEIKNILKNELKKLIQVIENRQNPFNLEQVNQYYQRYIIIRSDKE